ncbi:hypothetical protein [Burkholderia plantarii]|uniref:hypothetical protein n=1 Tax=Burkholderia plantarii TaxID=41899 RepID=UPI000A63F6BD|nr:hypothetical protein [Burkholderia plantarii]GLZ23097.1 hypothetical protein Bpla01_66260 [Burkholderia plantarii]
MSAFQSGCDGTTTPIYTIVTQVKSTRVIYFTDDSDYVPSADGDWYFASTYRGDLPPSMTLGNCWSWRFNGSDFAEAPPARHPNRAEAMIEHNRRALERILNDKINELRRPYAANCELGDELRQMKADEARAFSEDPSSRAHFGVLEGVALSRGISMAEAADLICKRAEQTRQALLATERMRERFTLLIAQANSEEALLRLRAILIQEIHPELSRKLKFAHPNIEPHQPQKCLTDHHRVHEISRLRARLREHINDVRSKLDDGYLRHDDILSLKIKGAAWVLSPVGDAPAGVGLLKNLADARGITMEAAASRILQEMANTAQILSQTERLKDLIEAQIDRVQTLEDIEQLEGKLKSNMLREFGTLTA